MIDCFTYTVKSACLMLPTNPNRYPEESCKLFESWKHVKYWKKWVSGLRKDEMKSGKGGKKMGKEVGGREKRKDAGGENRKRVKTERE